MGAEASWSPILCLDFVDKTNCCRETIDFVIDTIRKWFPCFTTSFKKGFEVNCDLNSPDTSTGTVCVDQTSDQELGMSYQINERHTVHAYIFVNSFTCAQSSEPTRERGAYSLYGHVPGCCAVM
jgi:hypothetical protein